MKVILHIGYPKTATSTLQDVLLHNLDKSRYNFIGRSSFSDAKEKEILDFFYNRSNKFNNFSLFDKNRINIISEEMLSLVICISEEGEYLKVEKLVKRMKIFFNKIEEYYNEKIELEVIITVRAQKTLLESLYVELFPWCFRLKYDFNTPEKFINSINNKLHEDLFKSFNFKYIIDTYRKHLTKNIKLICYEDLLYKKEDFFNDISTFFYINNKDFVRKAFEKKVNVKNMKKDKYLVNVNLSYYIAKFIYATKLINLYFKLRHVSAVKNTIKTIFSGLSRIRVKNYEIRKFSEYEKNKIYQFYKNDNKHLQEFIDIKKLEKYGYV